MLWVCLFRLPQVSSLYGRVYHFKRIYREESQSFLPVREGVSLCIYHCRLVCKFPPCTGGCVGNCPKKSIGTLVSSLYGRVYRYTYIQHLFLDRFLHVREGVSAKPWSEESETVFPPCTGGCIEPVYSRRCYKLVSSLYGRVYRHWKRSITVRRRFLPVREGVSEESIP